MLPDPLIDFLGAVYDAEKARLLGVPWLLCPIDWPERFGLVMIEAMSAGTPGICWDAGSARRS